MVKKQNRCSLCGEFNPKGNHAKSCRGVAGATPPSPGNNAAAASGSTADELRNDIARLEESAGLPNPWAFGSYDRLVFDRKTEEVKAQADRLRKQLAEIESQGSPQVDTEKVYAGYKELTTAKTGELPPPVPLNELEGLETIRDWNGGSITYLKQGYEESIRRLIEGRRIVSVTADRKIRLDTGVELQFEANEGCGGCGSGWYEITHLGDVDNVVTKVSFNHEEYGEGGGQRYELFVYTGEERINLLTVEGNDGNGYYGTGYRINIIVPPNPAEPV